MKTVAVRGAVAFLSVSMAWLAGCGTGAAPTAVQSVSSAPVAAPAGVTGSVYGGSQPISGATIQLWTVGTTGYGTGATALIPTTGSYALGGAPNCVASASQTCYTSVLTTSTGSFTLAGDFTCSPTTELVYLTATGGNPGANGTNSAISLMAALGPCNGITSSTHVKIDEATTVASVYALAQFMSTSGTVGSYGSSTVGITNALATVNNLVSIGTGAALATTPAGNGVVPQAEIDTIANILASCVNSNGSTVSGQPCYSLFTATTHGSSVPTNTLQAALNMALHPADNPSGQYSLVTTNGPFQPTLSSAPSDWAMAVEIAGTGAYPSDLAIDASGNVWVASYGAANTYGGASEVNNLGASVLSAQYSSSASGISSVAIDLSGNAWVGNKLNNEIFEIAPGGASTTGPFQLSETDKPEAIAVDGTNNVWITNGSSNSVTELSNAGASSKAVSPSGGYTGGGLHLPVGVAIDASNDAWVADLLGNALTEITPTGTVNGGYSGSGLNQPAILAFDINGHLWADNNNANTVAEFNGSGTEIDSGGSGISGGGISAGGGLSVDGGGNIWIADATGNALSEVNTSGTVISPANGYLGASPNLTTGTNCEGKTYSGGNMNYPYAVRVDSSGNVWVINYCEVEFSSSFYAGLTEFIGLGSPAITPLAAAVQQGLIGHNPGNTPGTTLAVTTSSLPSSVQTAKYSDQLLASGGTGNGYTWTVTIGASTLSSLGLTLSSSGVLSGTLNGTVSGASIGFKVTDSGGNTATATLSLTVNALTTLSITTTNIASASVGTAYNQLFAATGGSGSYTWSIPNTSGQLSALNAAGLGYGPRGTLNGTPTASGSFPFTMQVTDLATGQTATAPYTLIVNASTSSCSNYEGSSYTVSGTVSYSGTKTGQIYLALVPTNCSLGGGTVGTSISSAGTFTIRGVPSGATYTLEAFMDTLGKGADNAADPSGSTSVTVNSSSVSGVSLALSDPSTVTLSSGPSIQTMNGFNNGVFGLYNAIKSNNVEAATSYTLQWSTSSSFTTVAGSQTFPAVGTHSNAWFVKGLSNGNVYYFRAYGTSAGTAVSAYSPVYGPVTIGAPTGGNTVSGSLSFTGTATGPMYVGLLNNTTNAVYLQYIASPSNTQAYSVQVPTGSYELVAVLDQNNNGVLDAGDLQNTNLNQYQAISISGATANENFTLPSGNAVATVETQTDVSAAGVVQSYNLTFNVQEMAKLPVAVTLTSGPNVTEPIDIALCGQPGSNCGSNFRINTTLGTTAPTVGNSYGFNVTYSDGTTGTLTAAVTAVLTGYASNLAPSGTGASTTPTFSWTDPANAGNYVYSFELTQSNAGTIWEVPGGGNLTSSTTSLVWAVDPTESSNTPSVSSLTAGTTYYWGLTVQDVNGNSAVTETNFTVAGSSSSSLTIQTTSLSGGQVSSSYAQYISVGGGTTPYTAQVSSGSLPPGLSLATCTNCGGYFSISGTPTMAGTYSFTVKVTDSENPAVSASQAYSVTINSASSGTLSQCTHDGSGNALLNGHYAFLLGGFDPNGHYYDQIGSFVANGSGTITSGMADVNGDNGLTDFANGEQSYTFSGTYSIGSTDDRGIMTVSNSNTSATGLPATSIYCFAADTVTSGVANSGRIMEADGTGYLQTGVFAIQNTANFSASALNSGYAFGVQGVGNPPNREVAVGQFTLNGSGGVSSGQLDFALASNNGTSETYYAAQSIGSSGGYTMASNGRGTLALGSVNFVTYEFGNNQLFMLSTTNYNPPLLLGQATPQTLTTFTTANIAGRGVIRSDGSPGAVADNMQIGVLTYDGAGNATFISDENDAGTITTPSSVQTATYAVTSLGYLTLPGAGSHPVNMYLYAPGGGYGVSSASQVDFWTMVPQTVPNGGFTSSSISGAYTYGTIPSASYSLSGAGTTNGSAYPQISTGQVTFSSGTLSLVDDFDYPPGIAADFTPGETNSVSWALDSTYGANYGRVLIGGSGGLVGYIVSPSQVFLMNESTGKNGSLSILDHQ
jgi:hypothetical protein